MTNEWLKRGVVLFTVVAAGGLLVSCDKPEVPSVQILSTHQVMQTADSKLDSVKQNLLEMKIYRLPLNDYAAVTGAAATGTFSAVRNIDNQSCMLTITLPADKIATVAQDAMAPKQFYLGVGQSRWEMGKWTPILATTPIHSMKVGSGANEQGLIFVQFPRVDCLPDNPQLLEIVAVSFDNNGSLIKDQSTRFQVLLPK